MLGGKWVGETRVALSFMSLTEAYCRPASHAAWKLSPLAGGQHAGTMLYGGCSIGEDESKVEYAALYVTQRSGNATDTSLRELVIVANTQFKNVTEQHAGG